MARPQHGSYLSLEFLQGFNTNTASWTAEKAATHHFWVSEAGVSHEASEKKPSIKLYTYNYLYPDLMNDPNNRLDSTEEVIMGLKALGNAMSDQNDAPSGDSDIPSAYTYLGQFIDHDITREAASEDIANAAFHQPHFNPLDPSELKEKLKNTRSGSLDLDSLYGSMHASEGNPQFRLGMVSAPFLRPPHKSVNNDLPRSTSEKRLADIGDNRNDENTIVAQLHVAFLKFHNAVVTKEGVDFQAARKIVCQHYQWIVLHDFLKKICDATVVEKILTEGPSVYNPGEDDFFMPVEFSAAAYRFGHSMVRKNYDFNRFQTNTHLAQLFAFSGESGNMGGFPTLPGNWIIEWERFLPFETSIHNKARRIDTRLTVALEHLSGPKKVGIFQFLAKLNLLRGYLLSLPTGQALAREALEEQDVLTSEQILKNATEAEKAALLSAGLHEKTPLWYYILAEAAIQNGGAHLGKLGSTIVAETIIGLIRRSADSILQEENWKPLPGMPFNLEEMIRYAGLAPGQVEG